MLCSVVLSPQLSLHHSIVNITEFHLDPTTTCALILPLFKNNHNNTDISLALKEILEYPDRVYNKQMDI